MKHISFLMLFIVLIAAPIWADVSEKQIVQLSDQMTADITEAYGQPEELPADARLTKIFSNLVSHAKRKNVNYRLKVSESKDINAYAMPDGRIVFLSGLIKALPDDNDAPLAWVAAHEISHIEMRHAEKKMVNSLTSGIVLYLLVCKSSTAVQALGAISQGLLTSGYSRVKEYEADRNALVLMREAGYDPNGSLVTLNLFRDMEKKRKGLRIFPSHPRSADRCKSVLAWMQSSGLAVRDQGSGEVKAAQPQSQDRPSEMGGREVRQPESSGRTPDQAPALAPAQPANNNFIDMTLERPQPLNLPQRSGENSGAQK
ncbi:MAG: M48 family metallopeptidase [Vulcanimicrobiota bacterium]